VPDTLAAIQKELEAREPIFHRPAFGTTRADFDAMMTDDFWEIGASGKRYSRTVVLDVLEDRHRNPLHEHLQPTDFECRRLADNTYLLTYLLPQPGRLTRRTTIWQRINGTWKIAFHQGTIIQPE
jgi:hypothetical protein